jgi:hypothetical protein
MLRLFIFLSAILAFAAPQEAQAQRGLIFYGWYEDVEPITELPPTRLFQADGHQLKLGQKFTVYHVMWLPLAASADGSDTVLYYGEGDATRMFKLNSGDNDAIKAALGHEPLANYQFQFMRHIWGWLVALPLGFAFLAYRWLNSDDDWHLQYANKYENPEHLHYTENQSLLPAKPPVRGARLQQHPPGFGRKGL